MSVANCAAAALSGLKSPAAAQPATTPSSAAEQAPSKITSPSGT